MAIKNRNREKYTFANINLLGKCNADCFFCLGKDIQQLLDGKNQLNTHFSEWLDFDKFISMCDKERIKKLYITGQTADGLQYKYLEELVDFLQELGFLVGVRTNGYLALKKLDVINKMKEEIGYSIHTLDPFINKKIMGIDRLPDWDSIIPLSGNNVRVAIVINRFNVAEIYEIMDYISTFPNVRYIQLRRVSTDTREEFLERDIKCFEEFYNSFILDNEKIGEFSLAPIYKYKGKDVLFWRTVETCTNSLNYFTDGTCSDLYFIIEGYRKYHIGGL